MANTLGIPERTLAHVSSATNSINTIGGTDGRLTELQPLVVRISDHDRNDTDEVGTDTDKMAIFKSSAHGQPWINDTGIEHIVVKADANPVANPTASNATVIFPNFDYSTFG